jgi:hypothetical protein
MFQLVILVENLRQWFFKTLKHLSFYIICLPAYVEFECPVSPTDARVSINDSRNSNPPALSGVLFSLPVSVNKSSQLTHFARGYQFELIKIKECTYEVIQK